MLLVLLISFSKSCLCFSNSPAESAYEAESSIKVLVQPKVCSFKKKTNYSLWMDVWRLL